MKPSLILVLSLAGCSGGSGGNSSNLNCGSDGTSCSCSVETETSGKSLACNDTLGGGAVCCADSNYPSSSGTACVCLAMPKQVACAPTAGGSSCTCSTTGDGGATTCSLGSGVCCIAPGTETCTCYADQSTCGPTEMSFDHCDATVIGQNMTQSSFCAASRGPSQVHVSACSPFKP